MSGDVEARRHEERSFVLAYNTRAADVWCIVDAVWLTAWREFACNDGPLPGPITNARLLHRRSGAPRSGLAAGLDYTAVNPAVWAFLVERHGGGPVLRRAGPDVYGAPVAAASLASPLLGGDADWDTPTPSSSSDVDDSEGSAGCNCDAGCTVGGEPAPAAAASRRRGLSALLGGWRRRHKAQATGTREKCEGTTAVANRAVLVAANDARLVEQPRDGSCLFHAVAAGLADGSSAGVLRVEVAKFLVEHPDMAVAGTALHEWVRYESGGDLLGYAVKMAKESTWGGGIELEAVARLKRISVHVFEQCDSGFRRISTFGVDSPRCRVVSVVFLGRNHYDLMLRRDVSGRWSGSLPAPLHS